MSADPYLAEIFMFAGNFAPRGFLFCDGQLLQISANSALFSLVGTTYGGDGRTTFGIPELRGRFPMHAGNGPGRTSRRLGDKSGDETSVLNVNHLPPHSHPTPAYSGQGNKRDPGSNVLAKEPANVTAPYSDQVPDTALDSNSLGNTGSGQAHSIMNPFLAVNFIIATIGQFPSRS